MFPAITMIGSIFLASLAPQQDDTSSTGAVHPAANDVLKLRAEAARLENGHASDFFAALIQAMQPGNREGFTDEVPGMIRRADQATRDALQAPALIKQADQVTREVLQFWLARALASGSRPPTLDEWQHLQARIIGHAEAIVLEAVLRPRQAQRWRSRASRPRMPQLPGRYSIIPIDYVDGHVPEAYTRDEYHNVIHQIQYESRSSDLFHILLDPLAPPWRPSPVLTPQQLKLLERLDLLARNVKRYWWVRDVEPPPRPDPQEIGKLQPTPAMELRLSERGMWLRASIAAHAEEMALEAVLMPEQAEQAKIELWRRRGLHALLDPELAARLRLSRSQRDELAERLKERVEVYHKAIRTGFPLGDGKTPLEVVKMAQQGWRDELAQKVAALDQPIWEILHPAQLRALARLLNKPVAGYDPSTPKAKAKRSVR